MSDIPLGSIGVTQIAGDVGRLIRIGQYLNGDGFADYEHAFVYLGNGQIAEAEPGGARIAELTEYSARNTAWLRCPPEYGEAVAAAARAFTEPRPVPYSAADYFALAAHRLHLPIPWLRDYVKSSGHMICSQLVDRAAAAGGWHLFADGRWDGYVTPGDIWELIQQQDRPNWKRDFFTRSATTPDRPSQP
jgi:hypothetical protein